METQERPAEQKEQRQATDSTPSEMPAPGDSMNATVKKTVYVGGLGPAVGETDLLARLSSFGTVTALRLGRDASSPLGAHRGFAHVEVETTEVQWGRCVSAYNGTSWKGGRLRVEVARPDFAARYAFGSAGEAKAPDEKSSKDKDGDKLKVRRLVRHCANMALMTDARAGKQKGWKRSRYGRAVAMVRMKRPDGRWITVDPAHYKENILKLFGSVRPLPIAKLTWSITGTGNENKGQRAQGAKTVETAEVVEGEGEEESESESETDTDRDTGPAMEIEAKVEPEPEAATETETETEIEKEIEAEAEETGAKAQTKVEVKIKTEIETKGRAEGEKPRPNTGAEMGRKAAVADGEFSLGLLLGLQPEASAARPVPVEGESLQVVSAATVAKRAAQISVASVLYDFAQLANVSEAAGAFCRRGGAEEAYVVWKDSRLEWRRDFKDRMRRARKRGQPRSNKSS